MTEPYHRGRRLVADGMDHRLYPYSALPDRPPLRWPHGARVAVVVAVAVESRLTDPAAAGWRPPGAPAWLDVSVASLADYGSRVGYFRLAGLLAEVGAPATVPISDTVVRTAPRLVNHVLEHGGELVGHGPTGDHLVTSKLTGAAETGLLAGSLAVLGAATGSAPRGWSGPGMSESDRTPVLAAEVGYDYLLDWGNDDQPYQMRAGERSIVSLPLSVDTSDLFVLGGYAQTPWDFGDALRAHLDRLLAESTGTGTCLTVSLHAHLSGQAHQSRYVRRFLEYAAGLDGVWFARASDVVDAYLASTASSREPANSRTNAPDRSFGMLRSRDGAAEEV
ncbi:hypothetical protein [Micromonospora sp. NPDC047740]|uniref:hypothetical protein n=1 Tax=Micromonospora sp. NPDC047740 TaxID=3364254 RepID=UPI00371311DA